MQVLAAKCTLLRGSAPCSDYWPALPLQVLCAKGAPAWLAQLLGGEGPAAERTTALLLELARQRAVARRLQEQVAGLAQQGAGCSGAAERSVELLQQAACELAAVLGRPPPSAPRSTAAAAAAPGLQAVLLQQLLPLAQQLSRLSAQACSRQAELEAKLLRAQDAKAGGSDAGDALLRARLAAARDSARQANKAREQAERRAAGAEQKLGAAADQLSLAALEREQLRQEVRELRAAAGAAGTFAVEAGRNGQQAAGGSSGGGGGQPRAGQKAGKKEQQQRKREQAGGAPSSALADAASAAAGSPANGGQPAAAAAIAAAPEQQQLLQRPPPQQQQQLEELQQQQQQLEELQQQQQQLEELQQQQQQLEELQRELDLLKKQLLEGGRQQRAAEQQRDQMAALLAQQQHELLGKLKPKLRQGTLLPGQAHPQPGSNDQGPTADQRQDAGGHRGAAAVAGQPGQGGGVPVQVWRPAGTSLPDWRHWGSLLEQDEAPSIASGQQPEAAATLARNGLQLAPPLVGRAAEACHPPAAGAPAVTSSGAAAAAAGLGAATGAGPAAAALQPAAARSSDPKATPRIISWRDTIAKP
jgi:hypothetical protein